MFKPGNGWAGGLDKNASIKQIMGTRGLGRGVAVPGGSPRWHNPVITPWPVAEAPLVPVCLGTCPAPWPRRDPPRRFRPGLARLPKNLVAEDYGAARLMRVNRLINEPGFCNRPSPAARCRVLIY